MGKSYRDPLIESSGQQCRFAIPRMPERGNPVRINVVVRDQVIDTTLEAPSPGRDSSAIGWIVFRRIIRRQPGVNADAGVASIRIDVSAIKCRQGIAAPDNLAQGPIDCL